MFIPILAYHKIGNEFDLGINHVSPDTFERHIAYLANKGYRSITVSELPENSDTDENTRFVAITFDDAYRSVFEKAYPILTEYGFSATIFVITDFVGRTNSWDYTARRFQTEHCDWQQLQMLRDADWEIGSHTKSHPHLRFQKSAQIAIELRDSKDILEKELQTTVTTIAYPYGSYNAQVTVIAASLGYRYGCAMVSGYQDYQKHPLEIFRRGVYRYEPMAIFKAKLDNSALSKLNDIKQRTISTCAQSTVLRHYLRNR